MLWQSSMQHLSIALVVYISIDRPTCEQQYTHDLLNGGITNSANKTSCETEVWGVNVETV